MKIKPPYLIFFGDVPDKLAAKTGFGILDWRKDWCIGQSRLDGCAVNSDLPDMTVTEAVQNGAKTFVIGAVNAGGILPEHWISSIIDALEAGLDVASGLHVRLSENEKIKNTAQQHNRQLHDLRHSIQTFATGKGTKRTGKRLLTVGTDCSVGKKYTALQLEKEMQLAGLKATFCATGQTGILISQRGIAIDAVVSDFISGAAEWLSPDTNPNEWQVIEGQGSLFHPSFSGVSLGLLHGSQPDAFVVCHEPTRTNMRGVKSPLPSIKEVIDLTISCGQLTNPEIQCIGIAINTSALSESEARSILENASSEQNLPAVDPMRFGCKDIINQLVT